MNGYGEEQQIEKSEAKDYERVKSFRATLRDHRPHQWQQWTTENQTDRTDSAQVISRSERQIEW